MIPVDVEGAGGDVSEGLRRIESIAPNQPLVLMLLPHDQDVPAVWHTLAAVYTNVLTLAVVPAHKVWSDAHMRSRSRNTPPLVKRATARMQFCAQGS